VTIIGKNLYYLQAGSKENKLWIVGKTGTACVNDAIVSQSRAGLHHKLFYDGLATSDY